jgi:hypothetical protein
MMFHVVAHVPVDIPVNEIHVNCPAVETVIEDILCEAGVLGEAIGYRQPGAEQVGEADQ